MIFTVLKWNGLGCSPRLFLGEGRLNLWQWLPQKTKGRRRGPRKRRERAVFGGGRSQVVDGCSVGGKGGGISFEGAQGGKVNPAASVVWPGKRTLRGNHNDRRLVVEWIVGESVQQIGAEGEAGASGRSPFAIRVGGIKQLAEQGFFGPPVGIGMLAGQVFTVLKGVIVNRHPGSLELLADRSDFGVIHQTAPSWHRHAGQYQQNGHHDECLNQGETSGKRAF